VLSFMSVALPDAVRTYDLTDDPINDFYIILRDLKKSLGAIREKRC